jgi:tetratricopeptide (TPR) repeat protein
VAQQRTACLHSLFPPAGVPADPSNALGNLDGVQLGSKDIVSIINIAEQQMQSGAWELAAQTYSTWLQHSQSPLRYVAAYNLGSLWSGKGRPDQALSFFAQALQLNPGFVPGHFALALHLERVGQAAAAQPHYLWLADASNGVEASHRDIYQAALLKTGATQTPA